MKKNNFSEKIVEPQESLKVKNSGLNQEELTEIFLESFPGVKMEEPSTCSRASSQGVVK